MPSSVLKGIQSLLSGVQSTCWMCGALSRYQRGGYGLYGSRMGALPPFRGSSVSSASSCLGGVRGVSACISGRECLILDQDSQSGHSFLGDGQVSRYSLALPQPSRPHCISQRPEVSGSDSLRTGHPALSLPSPSCPALPWLPCSALTPGPLLLPPTSRAVTAAGCAEPRPDPVNDYISQQPLCRTKVSQPASPSMLCPCGGGGGCPPPCPLLTP